MNSKRGIKMTGKLKTEVYSRKTYLVEEVHVDDDNFEEVAKWCHGDVRTLVDHHKGTTTKYVKVRVYHPMKERQTQAFAGDHILYANNGFKVYSHKAFENSFEKVDPNVCKCADPSQCAPYSVDGLDSVEMDNVIQAAQTEVIFEDGAKYSQKVT